VPIELIGDVWIGWSLFARRTDENRRGPESLGA
jgi:hypothetical protein